MLALALLRREQEDRLQHLARETTSAERHALVAGLEADRRLVAERGRLLRDAGRARDAAILARVQADRDLSDALTELARQREVELGWEPVTPAAAVALAERAERARRRLAPVLADVERPSVMLDLPTASIAAVVSFAPSDGRPNAMVVVLPMPWAEYRAWAQHRDSLGLRLACLVVGGLTRFVVEAGAAEAPVRYAEVGGSLAVQLWLGDAPMPDDVRARALDAVQGILASASELDAAGVEVYVVQVRPELLAEADP